MLVEGWAPDIVVGIDFGMTSTGVAYSTAPEWAEPRTIMHWPGKASWETRSKVDTCVSYSAITQTLQNWGFECDEDDPSVEVNKLFKLFLDPRYVDNSGCAPSQDEIKQWYVDYLASLHLYVQRYCQERIPRFASKNVEWLFSIPTTWKEPSMMAEIERMIREAAFGKQSEHRISVSLTEAEAAAIYVSKQQMQRGDIFLVCDAGGGTTDINILKVISASRGGTQLEPLQWNEGAAIGSTLIDYKVEKLLLERLARIQGVLDTDPEAIVRDMIRTRFMSYKCAFGSSAMNAPSLILPIPGMPPGQDIEYAGIENSNLILLGEELQRIFDEQIAKICSLIDTQLQIVMNTHIGEKISYLVLSGGLGSSPYVRRKLQERYERTCGLQPYNARNMTVLIASEPQLAVVHGLVLARAQALRGGSEILSVRKCPLSYGIVCREVYDPAKHRGEEVTKDPYDNKKWAEGQVSWFIKQGQLVSIKDGVSQRFRHKVALGREREPWRTKIVTSSLPPDQLPRSLKSGGVQQVCTVETVLDASDMVLRNDKWYHLRKMYSIAEFDVRLLVGTGLHFEIWGRKGCMSRGHEEIAVHWEMPDGDAFAVHELDGMHPYDGTPELDSLQKLGEVHELEGLY
ncbi:Hsp70 family chaperone [Teratosphaeria destructans]|uniref:Hsp70 family chaperone n=1 Tax=Teratosphaeria destructans TaxID=418781 RepID=A0A9W7SWN9_9PEZI|nr:Hsp70 family chaperone [Teratosphaeria destructans]